jgi:hypothetical protein
MHPFPINCVPMAIVMRIETDSLAASLFSLKCNAVDDGLYGSPHVNMSA